MFDMGLSFVKLLLDETTSFNVSLDMVLSIVCVTKKKYTLKKWPLVKNNYVPVWTHIYVKQTSVLSIFCSKLHYFKHAILGLDGFRVVYIKLQTNQ